MDPAPEQALDIAQQLVLVDADQRHGLTLVACTAGAADAVDIVFRHVRQLEVDHMGQLIDVQAACGDVGGHQHPYRAVLESGQGAGARTLRLVAVDRGRGQAVAVELLGQAVRSVLGAGEHQHLAPVV